MSEKGPKLNDAVIEELNEEKYGIVMVGKTTVS